MKESEDWFEYAIECEERCKQLGPLDPAYSYFKREIEVGMYQAILCENKGE